jgi:RNA polymerase sigma-70 factor (ECF subfamily)
MARKTTGKANRLFPTTEWSLILAAGDSQSTDSRRALSTLCETYWYPVYVLVRHLGHDPDAARDLTQGFFAELLEKRSLRVADPDRGRFRSFLRASLHHFLSHERRHALAQKRGGGRPAVSVDFADAESRYALDMADDRDPEALFEVQWARMLLTRALQRLRESMSGSADQARLSQLEPYLTGSPSGARYKQLAAELSLSESGVKSAVHRMRRAFGAYLREEVGRTVDDPGEVDVEIRYLFSVLNS